MKLTKHTNQQLVLGLNDKKSLVYIQEENRKKHLLILGTNGSGKSGLVMPLLLKQDIENKKAGLTVFVGDKETALLMYSLARRNQREVRIVKPSITTSGDVLLNQSSYEYNLIKEQVVDFEQAIRKKEVIIVDTEFAIHQEKAIQMTAYLLHAFREAYLHENHEKETPHYLYVDDSHLYMPYIVPILMNGGEYGIGCTLSLESRQLLSEEEKSVLDSYIRNKMILSGLTIEDAKHLSEEIYERQLTFILNRDKVEFIYSTTDGKGRRTNGTGKFTPLEDELMASLRLSIPRHRGTILRNQTIESEPVSTKESTPKIENGEKNELEENLSVIANNEAPKSPVKEKRATDIKPVVQMPEQKQRERKKKQAARLTATIERESKRHVVILDDVFSDEDEF